MGAVFRTAYVQFLWKQQPPTGQSLSHRSGYGPRHGARVGGWGTR